MNYGELKHNLISKGFAEESDYLEFEELGYTYDAINEAIDQISKSFPYETYIEIEIDESDTGIMYLDMSERPGFLRFGETPVMFEKDGEEMWRKFTEYDIEMKRRIVLKADDYKGSFRIYYYKEPTRITRNTPDDFVFELPLDAHSMIPSLAAYYLWMDDDERKAVMYKNDFEELHNEVFVNQNKPEAKIMPGKWGDI